MAEADHEDSAAIDESGEAEPDNAKDDAAEPSGVDTEAEESDADAAGESAESVDDEAAAAEEPIPEATQSGWRLRLNSRLRRR